MKIETIKKCLETYERMIYSADACFSNGILSIGLSI